MSIPYLNNLPEEIAKGLLEIDAVALRPNEPFTGLPA